MKKAGVERTEKKRGKYFWTRSLFRLPALFKEPPCPGWDLSPRREGLGRNEMSPATRAWRRRMGAIAAFSARRCCRLGGGACPISDGPLFPLHGSNPDQPYGAT